MSTLTVTEHFVGVEQTHSEKVLYHAAKNAARNNHAQGRKRLLALCSHFSPDEEAANVGDALQVEMKKRKESLVKAKEQEAKTERESAEWETRVDMGRRVA